MFFLLLCTPAIDAGNFIDLLDMDFEYDFGQLMDLAETNKELAQLAYNRIYGSTPIHFSTDSNCFFMTKYAIDIDEQKICIQDYEYFKKLLQNFGHSVKQIQIEYDDQSYFSINGLLKQIAIRCTTLKELYVLNNEEYFEYFDDDENALRVKKEFPTLETLYFGHVNIDEGMNLNVSFPNITSINLIDVIASDPSFIEVKLPNLKHFGVVITCDHNVDNTISRENIETALSLNPQLMSVKFDMEMDVAFLDFVNKTLPSLEKLQLSPEPDDFADVTGGEILFKNVFFAGFELFDHPPPVASEQLNRLIIETEESGSVLDYIKKQHHLRCLTLMCEYNVQQMVELVRGLPILETLHLVVDKKKWPAKGLIRFLGACELLDEVELSLMVESTKRPWSRVISYLWKVTKDDGVDSFKIQKINRDN